MNETPISDPAFSLHVLVTGFPGKSVCHGGLGWSTIALVREGPRIILIDTGSFNARHSIHLGLKRLGLTPADITDVLLTHAHYDHALNWVLFSKARIHIGRAEMHWASGIGPGDHVLPELYIQALKVSPQLVLVEDGAEVLPNVRAVACGGHTPGSLAFVLKGARWTVVFTGDAAKSRAELLARRGHMQMNPDDSARTFDRIWALWRERPDTLLIPGHDLPMVLEDGQPRYVGEREAGVEAWYADDIETTTLFDFAAAGAR